jgi:protein phosphatase
MNGDSADDTAEYLLPDPGPQVQPPRPFSTLVQCDLGARTHQGHVRPNNEDRYLVVCLGRFLQVLMTNLEEGRVPHEFGDAAYAMAVADGMGGMAGGEVASRLALTVLLSLVLNTPDWIFSHDEPEHIEEVLRRAARRFGDVNAALLEEARRDPGLEGMGTTLTAAWSFGAYLNIAHLGDSRVYLFRQGDLHKLTRDHTMAQAMADAGEIAQQEVATHRLRHMLTHALGMPERGEQPEIQRLPLADGDRVLLCTDGLTEMVDDAAIAAVLRQTPSSAAACQSLVDLALERGGRDNVTVVMAGYRFPQGL